MPNGASDTCCYYFFFFFFCPSGLWIPALNFFFHGPTGRLVDGNMVLWVIALPGISMPLICVYCCCWSFGVVWVNLWLRKTTLLLSWVGVQGVESPRPPLRFLRDTAILEPVTPRIRTPWSTADWIEATKCAALAKGFLYMCGVVGFSLICGRICGVVLAGCRKPRSACMRVRCCAKAAED